MLFAAGIQRAVDFKKPEQIDLAGQRYVLCD